MSKPLVYVAGPITYGHLPTNVHNMVRVGTAIVNDGVVTPLIPYNGMWEFIEPQGDEFWYEYDKEVLTHCHAVFVHEWPKNKKSGVYTEVDLAKSLGIPVFDVLEDLYEWAENA